MFNALKYCGALLLLAFASLAAAEQTAVRTYQLAEHGSFQLTVPKSWHEEIQQPQNGQPLTIIFKPSSGPAFQIMVSPIYPRPGMVKPTMQNLKIKVESIIADISSQAVEKNIAIKEIRGPSAAGYYFTATDKAPAPGEFKLMTQALLGADELTIVRTVLTDDNSGAVLSQALDMIKSSKQVK